jgi:hypothetical protein
MESVRGMEGKIKTQCHWPRVASVVSKVDGMMLTRERSPEEWSRSPANDIEYEASNGNFSIDGVEGL